MMTISEAFQNWQDLLDESGNIDRDDGPAMAESWNDYVDALCKDGDLTELQHHCCPAWDDDMPAPEDELDFILRAMRVELTFSPIDARSPDSDDWPAGSRHFACTLTRGAESYTAQYSMGPGLKGDPALVDVFGCLLADTEHADEDFEDWCYLLGFDDDSRRAERMYRACRAVADGLADLFHADELRELRDLRELYESM